MPRSHASLVLLDASVSLVVAVLLIAAAPLHLGAQMNASASFSDVDAGTPYAADIRIAAARGLMTGYPDGRFGPGDTVNRAQLVTLIGRAVFSAADARACTGTVFPDADSAAWYAPYVCASQKAGIVQGYPDGTFHPDAPVTVGEAGKILALGFRLPINTQVSSPELWYYPYANALAAKGAMPDTYRAVDQQATRAEVAFQVRALTDPDSTDLHGAAPAEGDATTIVDEDMQRALLESQISLGDAVRNAQAYRDMRAQAPTVSGTAAVPGDEAPADTGVSGYVDDAVSDESVLVIAPSQAESCTPVECPAPPLRCGYTDLQRDDNGCLLSCGILRCEAQASSAAPASSSAPSCSFLACRAPPAGCKYAEPTYERGCMTNCGFIDCRVPPLTPFKQKATPQPTNQMNDHLIPGVSPIGGQILALSDDGSVAGAYLGGNGLALVDTRTDAVTTLVLPLGYAQLARLDTMAYVRFSGDGRYAFMAGYGGSAGYTTLVYDRVTGTFSILPAGVGSGDMRVSADGSVMAYVAYDQLHVYRRGGADVIIGPAAYYNAAVAPMALSDDGTRIAYTHRDAQYRATTYVIRDLRTGTETPVDTAGKNGILFSANLRFMAYSVTEPYPGGPRGSNTTRQRAFIADLQTGETTDLLAGTAFALSDYDGASVKYVSSDGRYVSLAYDWLYSTTGGNTFSRGFYILRYDRQTGVFTAANGASDNPAEVVNADAFARKVYGDGTYTLRVGRF
jgi:hypothetical protein